MVNGNWKGVGICSQPGSGVLVSLRHMKVRSNGDGNWRSTNRLSVQTLPVKYSFEEKELAPQILGAPIKRKGSSSNHHFSAAKWRITCIYIYIQHSFFFWVAKTV